MIVSMVFLGYEYCAEYFEAHEYSGNVIKLIEPSPRMDHDYRKLIIKDGNLHIKDGKYQLRSI
ncbi:hypothetical protein FTO68_08030 [Methanocalculus taiwanensis]|uniref:Uncharacterized protein n=1 Tax=Methanocalculus taiwanensis TaxID=106207 RepID=A0ABD4TLS3_9EURY|nr:hypothetical protein [Methanocalculus taiwanensis]MCQ1538928.1 hypothetical protein [Methanocalculus taiwanensis]